MRTLRLVALSDDGTHLILRSDGDETPMSLPLDERLHAAIRGDRARLGQLEIQMDSQLRPRDIQARVRSGESVQSVAAAAGVPLDKVMRFAGPVLAEREHIAGRAQQAIIRRINSDAQNRPLQETVAEWVSSFDVDPETVTWDAWRRDDGRWIVSARWQHQHADREACFTFDPTGRSVVPDNDEARSIAGERTDADDEPAQEVPVRPGPARLSVVSDPDDEAIMVGGPGVVQLDEGEADSEPTVPVPIAGQRAPYDVRRMRSERPPSSREERPDPWSRDREEPTSDRLRLSDIATHIEVEEITAPHEPVTARAAGDDVAPAQPDEAARPRPKRSRSKRPSVPSWDEIMFGRRDKSE
ncbi:MAG TPA: septation protein SepH [Jiangellales bacterium]|nr:septation protein SepH [Jiangellales bacterium]